MLDNVVDMRIHKAVRERAAVSRLVYIAAPFSARDRARELKDLLEAAGHVTTSSWITSHLSDYDQLTPEQLKVEAQHDARGVQRADAVVLINNEGPSTSGGMHVEIGLALGWAKPIILVGPKTCLFHHLTNFLFQVDSITEVADRLSRLDTKPTTGAQAGSTPQGGLHGLQ